MGLSRTNGEPVKIPAGSSVSVVITSFNHGRFLPDAIESVLRQTKPSTEIIVVDDGSTDNTADVAARYPEARYMYQENRGLSAARNTGVRASSGSCVVFLDADDLLEPCAIAVGTAYLDAHPDWAFVSGGHRRVTGELRPLGADCCWPVHADHYKALLRGNYIGMHAAVMYRRTTLELLGGFDEKLCVCEDYDLYLRTSRIYPVGSHAEIVALYRQHGANMSSRLEDMLSMALRVHRSQYVFTREDTALKAAWRQGVRNWWIYFGDQIMQQFRAQLRSQPASVIRSPGQFRLLLRVLRNYPFVWKYLRNSALRPRHLARRLRTTLHRMRHSSRPEPVIFGSFRSPVPLGSAEPANSVAARYIQSFLEAHRADMRDVLEIGPDEYPLERIGDLPDCSRSCVISVLQLRSFELDPVIAQMHRILRPSGVLLAVLPGVAMRCDPAIADDYWRFTALGARRLFARYFRESLEVAYCGNTVTALAALHRLPAASLDEQEFSMADSQQQLLVTVRAIRD